MTGKERIKKTLNLNIQWPEPSLKAIAALLLSGFVLLGTMATSFHCNNQKTQQEVKTSLDSTNKTVAVKLDSANKPLYKHGAEIDSIFNYVKADHATLEDLKTTVYQAKTGHMQDSIDISFLMTVMTGRVRR